MMNKINKYINNINFDKEPIYKNGKRGKKNLLYKIDGKEFLLKAVSGNCTHDELRTLHLIDSKVNDVILEITKESSIVLTNEEKNIINRRLFSRGKPTKISDEVETRMQRTAREEIYHFNRLLKEGEFRPNLPYYNKRGELMHTKSWALCDKQYNPENDDIWFTVKEEEAKYFKKYGHFPLRADNNNDKLGKKWLYIAFELAWTCSGNARGFCQCPEECYAKKMENARKSIRDRILKNINAWNNTTIEEKADFYTEWIINNKKGIRFCDTGDVPNQKALEEIFELTKQITKRLEKKGVDKLLGRFYIYSTRHDLDWSNKPWELVLNASNKELFEKVPDANWFRVIKSFDEIPEQYNDPKTLHICNCNCKACDYCANCRNTIIWEILG